VRDGKCDQVATVGIRLNEEDEFKGLIWPQSQDLGRFRLMIVCFEDVFGDASRASPIGLSHSPLCATTGLPAIPGARRRTVPCGATGRAGLTTTVPPGGSRFF